MAGQEGPVRGDIVVRQVRSAIGSKPKHRGTLQALGLGRIGKARRLPDRPEIRGMIARVTHLVSVEPAVETSIGKRTLGDGGAPEPSIRSGTPPGRAPGPARTAREGAS